MRDDRGGVVVVIDDVEPVSFASRFFAAVMLGVLIALANSRWNERETESFANF